MVTLLSETGRADAGGTGPRPGARAQHEAQRRREEAARLLEEADQLERTAAGQVRTASALAWLPPGFTVLHDLTLPGARAAVDHLVIGPTGVFAVSTEVHEGTVRYGTGTLWRNRHPMRRELQALVHEAGRLSAVLDTPIAAVVCFAHGDLPRRELTLEGARVLPMAELLGFVAERPPSLRADEVERLTQEAARLTRRGRLATTAPEMPITEVPLGTAPHEPVARLPISAMPASSELAPIAPIDGDPAARPRPRRRSSKALRTGAVLGAVGLLAYGAGAAVRLRTRTDTPATTAPASAVTDPRLDLAVVTSCPASGAGWTLSPVWPGLAAGTVAYDVSWRPSGAPTWITAGTWSSADQPSPTMLERLTTGAAIEVRLVALDDRHRSVGESVTELRAPPTPC